MKAVTRQVSVWCCISGRNSPHYLSDVKVNYSWLFTTDITRRMKKEIYWPISYRRNRGSISEKGKRFFFIPDSRTGSVAHPAYCLMCTGDSLPGVRGPSRKVDHAPNLLQRPRIRKIVPPLSPAHSWRATNRLSANLQARISLTSMFIYTRKGVTLHTLQRRGRMEE